MSTPATAPPARAKMATGLLAGLLLVVGGLLFFAIYILVPNHFDALETIGVLSVIFALLCYLSQSLSVQPSVQRALGWGFYGLGFTLLLALLLINPGGQLTVFWQLTGLIIVVLILAASIAGIAWRFRNVRSEEVRQEKRTEWQSRPAPSAFSYTAGGPTNAPAPASPPSNSPPTPPAGGR
jgi:hypothetical protein